MLDILSQSLWLVLDPGVFAVLLIGTAFGIVAGALPGLGSVIAVTICLPFTYALGQVTSIALLLAVYVGSVYGGSISAILINTPGTPQAAATTFDGYPMAVAGQADRALGWATFASVMGGLFSCLVLIFAAPQLAALALNFGPIEIAALIVLALTCIASVSRGSLAKGLLAGIMGLFVAVIGSDPLTGDMRYTFDIFAISAGFDVIPVVVGLFALSEVFIRAAEPQKAQGRMVRYTGMKLPSLSDMRGRWGVLLKSSGLGSIIGVLPGTGAATAAFIAYAEAKRSSPRRAGMGEGEPDGILAPESANNAVTGSALVPALALGIPGDAVTAVMLTALVVNGVTPGVRLMVDNPQIVYASFMALFLANIAMLVLAFASARLFAIVLRMPEALLMMSVVLLSVLGSYGVRGNVFDLYVMLAAGILGFVLRVFNVPLAPIVIGLVLGPKFEVALRQGLILTDGSFWPFLASPLALSLLLAAFLAILWPAYAGHRERKLSKAAPSDARGEAVSDSRDQS
uniref:tripartite tricarboxylate transporter permease n=1 Tax=Pararhizobium sp. IMCC3301 TaxID=3067904 RepID=UPI002740C7AA|nr:tripartite tricarboxylate transporter permease [Pararhizobium sp. IMCC3301]